MMKRQRNYEELVNCLDGRANKKITREDLEKEIYGFIGVIDPRSQLNTIRKLILDGYIKAIAETKPIIYIIE